MPTRAVRGAITTQEDAPEAILSATRRLLEAILHANPSLRADEIASAIFTMTQDLHSVYPAQAARQMGWAEVPLLCAQEISVPGSLPRTIRVLLHWNTDQPQAGVRHVYLEAARALRPDLASQVSRTADQEKQVPS